MKKAPESRNNLLATARALILQRGFSAMTVDAVCAAADVTKGSFFHHFNSKEALGEAVLAQFWADVQTRQEQAAYQHAADPSARLFGYIDHAIETYQDPVIGSGCLLAIYTLELKETYPGIYAQCVPHFVEWKNDLQALLQDAAGGCQPRCSFDAAAWAELYISTLEGVLILSRALNDPAVITRALTLFRDQVRVALDR